MPAAALTAALQSRDLFIYFGHGAGEQYLPPRALRRLPVCAAALLMGCSSGRLRPAGNYEPSGTVLAYLSAGEPNPQWRWCARTHVCVNVGV
jgi:separase